MKEKTRRIILSILTATCLCTCCNNEGSEQENHECTPTCDKNQECVNGECQVLSESSEENSERECDNDGVSVCDDNQVKTCKAGQFEYQNCTAAGLTCETTDEGVACVAAEKPECTDNDTPVCESNTLKSCVDGKLILENCPEICENGACVYSVETQCQLWINEHDNMSLPYDIYEGITEDLQLKSVLSKNIANPDQDNTYHLTATNALPYHIFKIHVNSSCGKTKLNYSGYTHDGERLALFVYNIETDTWDRMDDDITVDSYASNLVAVVNNKTYTKDGILCAMAAPELAANGSDTIAFTGDTQNYTSPNMYIDGKPNGIYKTLTTWVRNEYLAGHVAHFHHAGDMANSVVTTVEQLETEWQIVDEAHKITDDVGIPFSVSAGDHDTKIKSWNIRPFFEKTFPVSRYQNMIWYGGHYSSNYNFYSLVTIAGRDFIFLVTGKDDYPYDWGQSILNRYKHRIAVIGRHIYLVEPGDYGVFGQRIYSQFVRPHENVRLVLGGHIGKRIHQTSDVKGRPVVEIIVDHTDYNRTENGKGAEGYIRLISFRNGKMINTTYSPWLDTYLDDPEESWTEDFVLPDIVRELNSIQLSAEICSDCEASPVCGHNQKCRIDPDIDII